jgi:hypothetical protein
MINGFDSYKLSINNLNDINADTINSNTDKTTSLYINGQLIDFTSYVTSTYLSTTLSNYITSSFLTSTLSNYALTSSLSNYVLTSSLSNYVTNSSLSSTLNNYATTSALSSYRLISDSYNKSDVTNEVVIRTGYPGTNSDGSIKTCKQYTDETATSLAAATAVNSGAITGLVAGLATTNATIAVIEGEITTIQGELTTIDGQITTLQGKTQNQTATAGTTSFTGQVKINNLITLASNGSITADSINVTTGTISELTTNVNYDQHIYSNSSVTIGNVAAYTGISSINLNGLVYINGTLLTPFSAASSFFSQW